jgi:hypothetical protein
VEKWPLAKLKGNTYDGAKTRGGVDWANNNISSFKDRFGGHRIRPAG